MEQSKRISKQVLVVRKDLNMRKGKIASQCAHASMKVILDMMPPTRKGLEGENAILRHRMLDYWTDTAMADWLDGSFTKITVSVDSEPALLGLYEKALAAKIPCALIQDAGRTEFGGVPTHTAIAIGPAWSDEIDPLTGNLPLL